MTQFEQTLKIMSLCGAAFLSGLAVFHQFVLPSHIADANFKIARLEEQVQGSENARLVKQLAEAKAQIAKVSSVLAETQKRLLDIEYAPIFEKGSALPVGLRQIQPGEPVSRIAEVYPPTAIEPHKEEDWVTVRNQHKLFSDITYHFKDGTITTIAFYVGRTDVPVDFLKAKLTEALGEAEEDRVGKQKVYYWTTQELRAQLRGSTGLLSYAVRSVITTSSIKPTDKQRQKAPKQ